ncbi:MAG: hypothetical protein WCF77_00910 [Minisyncoccia bacterium]|jgi:transcription elongation factor Elf1
MESKDVVPCPCGNEKDVEILATGAKSGHGMVVGCDTCSLAFQCEIKRSLLGESCAEWRPLPQTPTKFREGR